MNSRHVIFLPQHEDKFRSGVMISVGLHIIVFVVLVVRAVFYPSEPMRLERSVRVDIVGLPDKPKVANQPLSAAKPEPAKPPEPPKAEPVRPEPVTPPKPVEVATAKPLLPKPQAKPDANKIDLSKTKKNQDSALKRLEALSRLEAAAVQKTPEKKELVVKGNEVSPGTALTGIARLERNDYLDKLDDMVKSNWNVPKWLANSNLKARVHLFLDSQGQILKLVLSQASANEVYNSSCIEAVQKAAPFPPPPARLVNVFAVDGLELGFPE